MKQMVVIATLLAAGLGAWAGLRAAPSPTDLRVGLFLLSGNLVLMAWAWYRARPGSGDALFLPDIVAISVAMLVGVAPPLLWPTNELVRIGALVASVSLVIIVVVRILRRTRRHLVY